MAKRQAEEENSGASSRYQKLSGIEHVLQRTDMYLGSKTPFVSEESLISDDGSFINKDVEVVPAFLQCVEEILMNACDRVSASHEEGSSINIKTTKIKVVCDSESISIVNNGDGIPCEMIVEHGVFAPELVFGHLLSSSNYDDDKKRLNSGRNGIGAKASNIFSSKFIVETIDGVNKKKYVQSFENNLSVIGKPKITKFSGEPYTSITFFPDFRKLNMVNMNDDIIGIIKRRCYEMSVTSYDPVKIFFNNSMVKINTVDKYMGLFVSDSSSRVSVNVNDRWRISVGFTPENEKFRHLTFVNSTHTKEGGTHLNYILNPLLYKLVTYYKKKFKATQLRHGLIKDNLTVFVSCFIESPSFASQTKDVLTTKPDEFGSICNIPDSIINKLVKTGLTDVVENFVKKKENSVMKSTDGKKSSKISGLPKLHDAELAGTKKSNECTLFLVEGDSANSFALSGLSVIGRKQYGTYPLKGKVLNVRDTSTSSISANAEISAIKKIIGLQSGVYYNDASNLRYGSVCILCDADNDGKHIAGLILNLFHCLWPGLIECGFVRAFNTPIVKVEGPRNFKKLFYSQSDFNGWIEQQDTSRFKVKYLKGLGSSTSAEAKDYFKSFLESIVTYKKDPDTDDSISLAFSKTRADDRKTWLSEYDSSKIIENDRKEVTVSEFVHEGLIHFSEADIRRSIPSAIDGLKTSQRKALFGCFKKGILNTECKVAQLASYIADVSSYHHGNVSMEKAIVGMAQDFVGSSNINLLSPEGQFGTRLSGGSDAASSRYIFAKMSKLTPLVYRQEDNPILSYKEDDGSFVEPIFYVPIICMSLVNGMEGIGTGFSTNVPMYNPIDIIKNTRRRINGQSPKVLEPYVRGFKGSIEKVSEFVYKSRGIYEVQGMFVKITELPLNSWTNTYKTFLEGLIEKKVIKSYTESCTDEVVNFSVTLETVPSDIEVALKLSSTFRTSNMHLYSSTDQIRKYDNAGSIESHHFNIRLDAYGKRKDFIMKVLEYQCKILESKVRFIKAKMCGDIVIDGVPEKDIMSKLESMGFEKFGSSFDDRSNSYDYIVNLKLFDFTKEKIFKLESDCKHKVDELETLRGTSIQSIWLKELDELEKKM